MQHDYMQKVMVILCYFQNPNNSEKVVIMR